MPKQEILISNQRKIKPNPTRNEMKTAHKINKEGKKKEQLKSTHTQTTNRPIKNKNKINSHKGEKVKNNSMNK